MTKPAVRLDLTKPEHGDAVTRHYLLLRDELVQGTVSADAILLETEVARQYSISRTPAREALARLAHEGFLERASRGYRVRVVDPATIVELYETRLALEVAACGAAALRRTALELARIEHTQAQAEAAEDPHELEVLRSAFHEAIWVASHNASMTDIIRRVFLQLRVFNSEKSARAVDNDRWRAEHATILAAIRGNDADAAEAGMHSHLHAALQRSLEMLARSS